MLASLRKVFGKSPLGDPFQVVAGEDTHRKVLRYVRPGGHQVGLDILLESMFLLRPVNWVKTLDTGTVTLTQGSAPELVLTTAATINTGPQVQASYDNGTTAWASFNAHASRKLIFEAEVELSDATDSAFLWGVSEVNTTMLSAASVINNTDFIGFYKAPGATALAAVVRKASTSTSQTLTGYAMANATAQKLGIVMDDRNAVHFFVDNVKIYSQTTMTNLPLAATNLVLSAALDANANAVKTAKIRRPFAYQEYIAA
jgi:hypothetical protein